MGSVNGSFKPLVWRIGFGCSIILGILALLLVIFFLDNPHEEAPYAVGIGAAICAGAFCAAEEQWCKLRSRIPLDPGLQLALIAISTLGCLLFHFMLQPRFTLEEFLRGLG